MTGHSERWAGFYTQPGTWPCVLGRNHARHPAHSGGRLWSESELVDVPPPQGVLHVGLKAGMQDGGEGDMASVLEGGRGVAEEIGAEGL